MKNLPIYFFILVFFSFTSSVIAQDDVYYDPSDDQIAPIEAYDVVDDADYDNYIAYDGVEEEAADIDIDNDYNYCYAARIKRFNRSYQGFNYFDPCYTDTYYYNSANTGNSIYYVNSSNGFWTVDRNNRWVYIFNNPYSGFANSNSYNPYYGYTNNSYGYGTYTAGSSYYGNYGNQYGSAAYNPYCNPYSTASPYTAGGGNWGNNINSTPTTTTVRPTRGNNIPGTPTTTTPAPPRGGNGQTATNAPKPNLGKTKTTVKPTITKTKASRYTKPSTGSTKYNKPSRSYNKPSRSTTKPSYNKPSRSTTTPSYNKPSRSSTPSYNSPSRSGNTGGSRSSGSSRGMRGGK